MENINVDDTNEVVRDSEKKCTDKKMVTGVASFIGMIIIGCIKVAIKNSVLGQKNYSWSRGKRDVTSNSTESKPDFNYFNTYSAEIITLLIIVIIEYILTGVIFWYSKKGKYKLILPYLMFLIVTINVLLIFFLYITNENFQNSTQTGFLVLACGLIIIANGVYFWIIMYRRYQNLKDAEYLQPII